MAEGNSRDGSGEASSQRRLVPTKEWRTACICLHVASGGL